MIIKDFLGFEWVSESAKQCQNTGLYVHFGRKIGVKGGASVIITTELRDYFNNHTFTHIIHTLPIGTTVIKRIYKVLDDNQAWFERDLTDPSRPYNPPICKRGDIITDAITGDVVVGGYYRHGNQDWIYRKDTGRPILCGDLIVAVKVESAKDIAEMFGVTSGTVTKWRKALGVDNQNNAGTQRFYKQLAVVKLTPDVAQRGRDKAKSPESIAKMRETKRKRNKQ